jgi:hypothetical protein
MGILGQIFLLLFKLIRQRKKKQRENPGVLRNSAEPHIYYRKLLGEHGGEMFRNTVYTQKKRLITGGEYLLSGIYY